MNKSVMTIGLGAIISIIGVFLPWQEILGITFYLWGNGPVSKFIIAFGVIGFALAFQGNKKDSKGMKIGALLMSLFILGIIGKNAPSNDGFDNLKGVYVLLLGAFTMLGGSIALLIPKKK